VCAGCPKVTAGITADQEGAITAARSPVSWFTPHDDPGQTLGVVTGETDDGDPVPPAIIRDLDEAFRVLEALEDARLALREAGAAPGLQDELATVIRMLHGNLGFDEGGVP
jgi:hypothetical protein